MCFLGDRIHSEALISLLTFTSMYGRIMGVFPALNGYLLDYRSLFLTIYIRFPNVYERLPSFDMFSGQLYNFWSVDKLFSNVHKHGWKSYGRFPRIHKRFRALISSLISRIGVFLTTSKLFPRVSERVPSFPVFSRRSYTFLEP